MKLYKKSFISLFDWLSLLISLGLIIFIVLFVLLSKRDYTSLRSSINNLSKSANAIKALQNASHNLLLSENNFQIFLNTGDIKFKNSFLRSIYSTIDELTQIQQGSDGKKIDSMIMVLGENIQLSSMIEYLKNISDSIANNMIKAPAASYDNLTFPKIGEAVLERYMQADTVRIDSSTHTAKRGFLNRIFGKQKETVKTKVTTRQSGSSSTETSAAPANSKGGADLQNRKIDSLINNIHRFYKSSVNEEIKARQLIAEKDKQIAKNDLFIINNLDNLLQQIIKNVQQEKENSDKNELNNAANKLNVFHSKQEWWVAATGLFAITILLINLVRVFKKTSEINLKNDVLKRKNDMNIRLISIINHDIVAPLRFLSITSKSLAESGKAISEGLRAHAITEIQNISEKLENIAKNILDWIKYQNLDKALPKEEVNIHQLTNEIFAIFKPLAKHNDVALNNLLPAGSVISHLPAQPLRIILQNLIINAIKFSSSGTVEVSGRTTENEWVITIKDEGVGMDNEQVSSILNSEFIASSADVNMDKGTGLGLLIVKELLPLINAQMFIQSKKNKGTTVTVVLTQNDTN